MNLRAPGMEESPRFAVCVRVCVRACVCLVVGAVPFSTWQILQLYCHARCIWVNCFHYIMAICVPRTIKQWYTIFIAIIKLFNYSSLGIHTLYKGQFLIIYKKVVDLHTHTHTLCGSYFVYINLVIAQVARKHQPAMKLISLDVSATSSCLHQ